MAKPVSTRTRLPEPRQVKNCQPRDIMASTTPSTAMTRAGQLGPPGETVMCITEAGDDGAAVIEGTHPILAGRPEPDSLFVRLAGLRSAEGGRLDAATAISIQRSSYEQQAGKPGGLCIEHVQDDLGWLLPCRSERRRRASRPVGRVLCTRLRGLAAIHLGLPLPAASCGLPASIGRAALNRSRSHRAPKNAAPF